MHANVKKKKIDLFKRNPDIAKNPHLHLPELERIIIGSFTQENIKMALIETGFNFLVSADQRFIGVDDEHVSAFADKLIQKGILHEDSKLSSRQEQGDQTDRSGGLHRQQRRHCGRCRLRESLWQSRGSLLAQRRCKGLTAAHRRWIQHAIPERENRKWSPS